MDREKLILQIMKDAEKDGEPLTREDAEYVADLEIKAKGNIDHDASSGTRKKSDKPKVVKVSQEKEQLFADICAFLTEKYAFNVVTNNKLVEITINDKTFKLNLSENRQKKA